jgi:MFS family permease
MAGRSAGLGPGTVPGPFAALRRRLFAVLLGVQLVHASAVWSHVVTVQWMLTERGESAAVVSSAPAAMALPFLVLALPVGAVVGFASRERLHAVAMLASATSAGAAALLAAADVANAALLVGTVLVVGAALVVVGVAWQSLITELVGRPLLGSATVLDGAIFNVARAVGPLVAGIGLGLTGSSVTFAGTAVAFAACGTVFLALELRRPGRREAPRPIVPDIVEALRFARFSPWTRRLLTRMVMFGLPASALWALVSLVVHDRLGLDSRGFGVVMALLGSGAVVATFVLPPLRTRLSVPVFAAAGSLAYAVTMLVLGLSTSRVLIGAVLVLGGVAWVGVQSTWMMLVHQAMPDWVRPRIIALLLLLFQGTQAVGALLWGLVADLTGLSVALFGATGLMVVSVLALLRGGLGSSAGIEPVLAEVDTVLHEGLGRTGDGELEVRYEYAVPDRCREQFGAAIERLRMSRLRLGARDWRLAPHPGEPGVLVETYRVPSRQDLLAQESVRLTVPEARLRTAVREATTEVRGPLTSPAPARDHTRVGRGRSARGASR